jgi:hypothetical protein
MTTGNVKQKKDKSAADARALNLRISRGRIIVSLDDEREISIPLEWYPTLKRATTAKRSNWILLGEGQGFHSPDLDLDLSVAGLTNGLREMIPPPPVGATNGRQHRVAG